MTGIVILAATIFSASQRGVDFSVQCDDTKIDPARSMVVTLEMKTAPGVSASLPDIRNRARGFSLADDFSDGPRKEADGSTFHSAEWWLVPEPCAKTYKIAPFAIEAHDAEGNAFSFVAGPVKFDPPDALKSPGGEMEIDPKRDLPPFSWTLLGEIVLCILAAAAVLFCAWLAVKRIFGKVREHFKSPIERAWTELDRLVKKGLPQRGKYKDFYVELTMVVRRYVRRKYGIKAPHLTTEEFFAEIARERADFFAAEELKAFLENADLVKFAGVEATVSMAETATESARDYLKRDNAREAGNEAGGK